MTELTEAEIERLEDAIYAVLAERNDSIPVGGDAFAAAHGVAVEVAALIDARLAPIRALADEWLGVAATYSRDRVLEKYVPGLLMAAEELAWEWS